MCEVILERALSLSEKRVVVFVLAVAYEII